ncbi:MAG: HAMP domain-containing histidine kinase [Hyphomicrobiaceae bacterium]
MSNLLAMPEPRSIDALEQPAIVIDTARPAICAINVGGRRLWGMDNGVAMPVALDPAMPALTQLRLAAAKPVRNGDASPDSGMHGLPASLVFWTAVGAQSLKCRCQPGVTPDTVLVVFETGTQKDAPTAVAASTPTTAPATLDDGDDGLDMHAMAHELRTPIGAIIALAEMIETEQFGAIGDPRYREYARDIGDSARLSLNIVASALDRDAACQAGLLNNFVELSVSELIRKSLRTVRQSALEAKVSLVPEISDDLPDLIANGPGLTQILLNLLTNAIKFTPAGGTITIIATESVDGSLSISVRDTGVGMTGIDTNVLIADIDQTEPSGDQVAPTTRTARRGIGFSLVRRLAQAMAATFDVTSTRGVGTCVTLTFPATKVIPVARHAADR